MEKAGNPNSLNYQEILNSYLKYWKWFALSAFLFLFGAFIHLRYAVPKYEASAKIQILEDKGASSELSVLRDLDVFSSGGAAPKIVDEIELLNARSNYVQVIKNLKLNIRYFVEGNFRDNELYRRYPFAINFLSPDSIVDKYDKKFFVNIVSNTEFDYAEEQDGPYKKFSFGSKIKTNSGDVILLPEDENFSQFKGKTVRVEIKPLSLVVQNYRAAVSMKIAGEFSNIINLSMTDSKKQRAVDVLNNLIDINNENAVQDKKAIADRTKEFINERITEIYSSLSTVDKSAETFKESRGIADLGSQSNVNFSQSAASEQELQNVSIQRSIANSMKDLISNQNGYDIIPGNLGLNDQGIASTASRYNELVSQRNRLLKSSNEKNPVIVKLDQQLESLKRGMQSSLNNVTNNLDLQVNSLSKQLSQINSRIYAAPGNERALRDITRKQQTTESLYLYLLQKREESQITFASASPKSKVINYGFSSPFPVSPKGKITYLAALIIGLLIPTSFVYVKNLLDNKIHNKVDLERLVKKIPILGEVPKLAKKDLKIIQREDRSILAESFRILRTNLDYILKSRNKRNTSNVVLVTSSVSGDGKTFISSNLALIFSSAGKRVLLLGADIRNPRVFNFFKSDGDVEMQKLPNGLTEYLFQDDMEPEDIIDKNVFGGTGLDIIYSGSIPPNPSELLLSNRLDDLFEDLRKKYDYIIVDSAPLLAVTDSLLLEKHSDQVLYVTKSNSTEKKVLDFPLNLYEEGKIRNLSFLVNGVKESDLGYGGKYGYGYGQRQKKWWEFDLKGLFNIFSITSRRQAKA